MKRFMMLAAGMLVAAGALPAAEAADPAAATATAEAAATPAPAPAETPPAPKPAFKLSGVIFGDAFYLARQSGPQEGKAGAWIRRFNLVYDADLDELHALRFRFEAFNNDTAALPATMIPYVKEAYVARKLGAHRAALGLVESPTWGVAEELWGYRSMERTPLDLYGWGSIRDLGLSLRGSRHGGWLACHAVVGNGSGTQSESNFGKKYYLSLQARPGPALVELYGDFETHVGGDPGAHQYVGQLLAGLKGAWGRLGLQYAHNALAPSAGAREVRQELVSGFIVWNLAAPLSLVLRADHLLYETKAKAAQTYLQTSPQRSTFGLVGLDWRLSDKVKLQPNVEMAYYQNDSGGPVPEEEVIPRLTFAYSF